MLEQNKIPFLLLKEDWPFWFFFEKCQFVEITRMHIVLTELGNTNVLNGGRHVEMVSGRYFEGRLGVTTVLSMARCRGDCDTETLYLTLFTLREILPLGDKWVKHMGRSRMRAIATSRMGLANLSQLGKSEVQWKALERKGKQCFTSQCRLFF